MTRPDWDVVDGELRRARIVLASGRSHARRGDESQAWSRVRLGLEAMTMALLLIGGNE